jgi:amidohydrolase
VTELRSKSIRDNLLAAIDARRPLVEEIARSLYERPELGLAERFASSRLKEILSAHGFSIESGLAGLPTSFAARAGQGRPVLAFMAEYDALPAIGHGCGHNLIAACAVVAGICCRQVLPGVLPDVSWLVLGTPAEETVGGKVAMAEAGVFENVDAAFIAHPGQRNSLGGASWSSHPIEITFLGRASHAGGNPQEGINALDALVTAYLSIRNLKNQLRDDARLAGIITHGGDAQNIVPDRTTARFTVRARDWRYLETVVLPKVKLCAEGAAQAFGARVEFRHHEPLFKETLEHPVLKQIVQANFEALGEEVHPLPEGFGGGTTDVGSVTWVTPCVQIGFKITDARGHSREMAEATMTPLALDKTIMAAKVLALSALDLAEHPDLLARAKRYLESRRE